MKHREGAPFTMKYIALITLLALSSCASKPDPEPEPVETYPWPPAGWETFGPFGV